MVVTSEIKATDTQDVVLCKTRSQYETNSSFDSQLPALTHLTFMLSLPFSQSLSQH